MFVSKKQPGVASADGSVAEALSWLERELAWEAVLTSLRQAAGIEVPAPLAGPQRAAA